ncbi:retrograde regulation protein 2 [Ilyonectria robusta]
MQHPISHTHHPEVNDSLCVEMTRTTYEGMRDRGLTDDFVCRGLHDATRKLRDGWISTRAATKGKRPSVRRAEMRSAAGEMSAKSAGQRDEGARFPKMLFSALTQRTWGYCHGFHVFISTRLAIFFSAASLAGAFSGLLAFRISHMDGIAGLSGGRWIFILEGIFTVALGLLIPWLLPDSPVLAAFLTQYEKVFVTTRLEVDSGTSRGRVDTQGGSFKWKYLRDALLDWHIYLGVLIYLGQRFVNPF